jgi:hypothetical protein
MTSAPLTPVVETLGYRAPLALRCRDATSAVDVSYGIVASAWRDGDPSATRVATGSKVSTLLGFGVLPGLRALTYARADGSALPSWPAAPGEPFMISVVDTENRYLPQVFGLQLPQTAPVDVLLYTAPTRPPPSAWGCVGGEVHVAADGTAAAWALVDLVVDASSYSALCDEHGRFLIYLPYPEALPVLAGSPPHGSGLGALNWPVTVSVRYEPSSLAWPVNPAPVGPPDVVSIRSQGAASVGIGLSPPNAPSLTQTLQFGRTLHLQLKVTPA